MAVAFNKVTHHWCATETPGDLSPDWIIDPVFDDRERADLIGPKYWTYSGNNVHAMTDAEINVYSDFIEQGKDDVKQQINDFRTDWMNQYFTFDGKQWDCDDRGVTNIIATVLIGVVAVVSGAPAANALPDNAVFRDRNNVNHPVTFLYMVQMALACFQFKQSVYQTSWELKALIDTLSTLNDVKGFDFISPSLWPSKD